MVELRRSFQITYYDHADLNYASFFLLGFIENEKIFNYKFKVSKAIPEIIKGQTITSSWNDILFSICLFKIETCNETFHFCIDTRDSNNANVETGKGFHLPLLNEVRYYFKVNYNKDIIAQDILLSKFSEKIVPVLPFFPIKINKPFIYLPKIIPSETTHWKPFDIKKRLKFILRNFTLEKMIDLRNTQKEHDIFFLTNYYRGKYHETDNEFRYQLITEIRKNRILNAISGFVGPDLPKKYKEAEVQGLKIKNYLYELAKSRVAIYVRGMLDCISFKFSQYLAIGLPIIGQPLRNNQENIMQFENFDHQFVYEEPRQIVDRVVELINQPESLTKLGKSNAKVFDEHLKPHIVVDEILRHLVD